MTEAEVLELAITAHREGNVEDAKKLYVAVLTKNPENPDALHYLGLLIYQAGEREEGASLIEKSLSIAPEQPQALNNLGNIYRLLGEDDDAMKAYWAAVKIAPDHANAWANMAVVHRNRDQTDLAENVLTIALTFEPRSFAARHTLAMTKTDKKDLEGAYRLFKELAKDSPEKGSYASLYSNILNYFGKDDEALDLLLDWQKRDPGNPIVEHHVDAQRGARSDGASNDYIFNTFEQFAETFEGVLKGLHYQAPDLIAEIVKSRAGSDRFESGIDIGCGTGLLGPLIKDHVGALTGIDLSPNMLARAQRKKVYDDLVEGEIIDYLNDGPAARFDLATAADVFCYFGDMRPAFQAIAHSVKPKGTVIATFEALNDETAEDGFKLTQTGRYTHTEHYLRAAAQDAGFVQPTFERVELRQQFENMVEGILLTAVRGD